MWLANLQHGSVQVAVGDAVARGQLLGRVGNSGNTTEPHLHLHAERGGAGVPIRWAGLWPTRNTRLPGALPSQSMPPSETATVSG